MAFSDLKVEGLLGSPLRLPPAPHELRLVPVLGLEQGGADGFRQAGIVEADAKVVLRAVAAGARRPGVADAGLADEDPEDRRVQIGRASCRQEGASTFRARWPP